jgi:hypothetical protein
LCRPFLTGCTTDSRKLRFLKSSPILLAYIALLGGPRCDGVADGYRDRKVAPTAQPVLSDPPVRTRLGPQSDRFDRIARRETGFRCFRGAGSFDDSLNRGLLVQQPGPAGLGFGFLIFSHAPLMPGFIRRVELLCDHAHPAALRTLLEPNISAAAFN